MGKSKAETVAALASRDHRPQSGMGIVEQIAGRWPTLKRGLVHCDLKPST
jgi:hypothetical protein